jgi:hypothetical protein
VIAELCNLGLPVESRSVQGLDVGQMQREVEAFQIDPSVDDRIDHETVVRTR